jgi:hypothetical protein
MFHNTMRTLLLGLVWCASAAQAQGTPEIPAEKVVVIPLNDGFDAGISAEVRVPAMDAPVQPAMEPPPPVLTLAPPAPVEVATPPVAAGPMVDGHLREGSFLSGPGSFTFLMHHTLMTGFGVLATQMIPRAIDASPAFEAVLDVPGGGCVAGSPPTTGRYQAEKLTSCADIVSGEGARLAYLTGTLLGAGVGFTSAAIWQFNKWISPRSAHFGIATSFIGGMFFGSLTDLITKHSDAYAISWMTLIGSSVGAWVAAIVGGGDIAHNKIALILTGAAWAMIYTALTVGIVATTGGGITPRGALDAVMLTPAVGAAALALATLKFNPSVTQILRANFFGAAVGGTILLLSGLLLGPATGFTKSPVPYILAGIGAMGAKTLVSVLWADTGDSATAGQGPDGQRRYRHVWW